MQEYVREHEVEKLLSLYNDLQGMAETIKIQMSGLESSKATDDDIEAMALKHATFDDTPSHPPGAITDKTSRIALKYESTINHEMHDAIQELEEELLLIQSVVAKLDIGLSVISPIQKEIVTSRYCRGLKWDEIEDAINKTEYIMSASSAKTRCKEGLKRLCIVSRISISEYQAVMKLFNLEETGGECDG